MPTALSTKLRTELRRYLKGEIPLQVFDAWFTPATWDVERSGDPEAEWLSNEIILRLAEFSRGHWREDELRERFGSLQPVWWNPLHEDSSGTETHSIIVLSQPLTGGARLHLHSDMEQASARASADQSRFQELKIPAA